MGFVFEVVAADAHGHTKGFEAVGPHSGGNAVRQGQENVMRRLRGLHVVLYNRSGTVLRTLPFCAYGTKSVSCELQRAFAAIKCFLEHFNGVQTI